MAALDYHVLDVFTTERFGGNPLAVVLDADGLDGKRMQTIAREFNLSETVFVLKPSHASHTARVRIFTPAAEMPFAGHPTVGTACLLAQLRLPAAQEGSEALVVLEEEIGLVRVGVRMRRGSAPFAEFDAPRLPEELGSPPAVDGPRRSGRADPGRDRFRKPPPDPVFGGQRLPVFAGGVA